MASEHSNTVKHRRVFYIPGYDPIHPRRYRELYRMESAVQGDISDYRMGLSPREGERYGWNVEAEIEGADVRAEVEVLVWSDIVRTSLSTSIPATYWQLARTSWIYIASGALRRLMWLRKGPVIAALYPVGMLLAQLIGALLVAYLASTILTQALSWSVEQVHRLLSLQFDPAASVWSLVMRAIYWATFLVVLTLVLRWFKARDNKLYAYYLMHDYAFSAKAKGAYPPELRARMAEFGDVIAAALREDVDEVLVVGHSSGAHLAVSVLADLVRAGCVPANGPALSFLSLGQVVPMLSFLPMADQLRADLNYLSQRDEVTWVDVTAPGDGCAFALCDPVAVSGVAPENQKGPLVISAAFTQTLSPERWKALRWRFFRLHFQYLCAFDRPGDYDYFKITAGPLTLGERYAGRKASLNRIDVAASCHTSMAA
ncbi:MAG: hypothetical protein LJE68_12850 [Rhodobacter sp.]|nr:hypothetical protein [Rhodobacter sp.]